MEIGCCRTIRGEKSVTDALMSSLFGLHAAPWLTRHRKPPYIYHRDSFTIWFIMATPQFGGTGICPRIKDVL
jgi:hypothetical protein